MMAARNWLVWYCLLIAEGMTFALSLEVMLVCVSASFWLLADWMKHGGEGRAREMTSHWPFLGAHD